MYIFINIFLRCFIKSSVLHKKNIYQLNALNVCIKCNLSTNFLSNIYKMYLNRVYNKILY